MKNPCRRDCPYRRAATKETPSCHAYCEAYQAFWDANRARNGEKLRFASIDGITIDGLQKAEKARRLVKGKLYSKRK